MFKVNSKKAVHLLSDRSLKGNKSRNVIAALAIALTAVLFTALFTVSSGLVENIQRQTMRQAGGDGMGVLKYLTDEQYEKVKDHQLIKEISYNRILCDSVDNEELLKRRGELYFLDDTAIKLGFCEPSQGHRPQLANEIMMDTKAIKMLGVKQEIGAPVTLELTVHGTPVTRDFVLSGWWEADPVFNVSILVTSRAYMEEHMDELYNSYQEDYDLTGVINSYIMFQNSWNLEEKLHRVITESGFSENEEDANYIASNVNWSYLSTNFNADPQTVAAVAAALLLIVFTGYLIIYNIFQISVIRDIRFYGLLKTIGTTGKQIRKMIHRQAVFLSCIGIPFGLAAGYLAGCRIVPMIMDQSNYAGGQYQVSANPLIFVGSTVFALVTVWISTARPGRIAAGVSPVEAVRYTEESVRGKTGKGKKGSRRKKGGAGILSMAAANLGRNKKRTVLVLLSMSLSLVLFNTVYTFSIGFDMDKFLSKFVDTDYLIAHAEYFNFQFAGPENSVSEQMIQAVQAQPGFEEGGRIYANIRDAERFSVEDDASDMVYKTTKAYDGNQICVVYGLEDLPLERLRVLEGTIDVEKLKTGRYILEGVALHDDETPFWQTSHYDVGDKVVLHNYKGDGDSEEENVYQTREFEVMAKVAVKYYTNSCGSGYDYNFYLPADTYLDLVENPGVMSYSYNVEQAGEESMDAFLQNYTENVDPVMNYSSKATRVKEFEGLRNMILMVGGALSLIIGLIGILNFVNSMLTSILTRRREFAMLQSIGMTTKQLRRMLVTEGMYYTVSSGALSILLGVLLSIICVKSFSENMWFFTYQFTVVPLIATIPMLLLIGAVLPVLVLRGVTKQSVVERLRESE